MKEDERQKRIANFIVNEWIGGIKKINPTAFLIPQQLQALTKKMLRGYVIARKGQRFCQRDYNYTCSRKIKWTKHEQYNYDRLARKRI